MFSRWSTRCFFKLSFTHLSASGLPVRYVGQAVLASPALGAGEGVVSVLPGEVARRTHPDGDVTRRRQRSSRRSRSTDGTRLGGPACAKNSPGSAVTMWKCSPVGSITRNANTVSICSQYDSCQPARSVPSGRPANHRRQRRRPPRRSCARERCPDRSLVNNTKRNPSNREIGHHDRRDQREDQNSPRDSLRAARASARTGDGTRRPTAASTASSTKSLAPANSPPGQPG